MDKIIFGPSGPAGLAPFWEAANKDPRWKDPFAVKIEGPMMAKTIPLSWHCDGAEIHRDTEYYIWSWGTMMAHGSALDTKIPIAVVPYSMIRTKARREHVNDVITKFIAWCVDVFERGSRVSKNWFAFPQTSSYPGLGGSPFIERCFVFQMPVSSAALSRQLLCIISQKNQLFEFINSAQNPIDTTFAFPSNCFLRPSLPHETYECLIVSFTGWGERRGVANNKRWGQNGISMGSGLRAGTYHWLLQRSIPTWRAAI